MYRAEVLKRLWKDDPLICPECQSEMKIISFIENPKIIKKVLKYLNLWDEESVRDPPVPLEIPDDVFLSTLMRNTWDKIVYVPIEDAAWVQHENPGYTD